jgi:hypothetical protein
MKALVCIVLVTMTISIYGQDSELLMKGDTVIIRGYGIVADPFMFGENALDFLMRMNGSVEVSTVENRHVDNKVSSVSIGA